MKILIPTAKTIKKLNKGYREEKLSQKTEIILENLLNLPKEKLQEIYKIKEEKLSLEIERLKEIKNLTGKSFEAIYLFDGMMYKNIKRDNLSEKEKDYYKSHVFIPSALYGIINSFSKIFPYRLDFSQKIKIRGESLKKYWQDDYDKFVEKENLVISLLSKEFEEVFSKETREKFIKINFLEEKDGKYKSHSTISKKARGKFLTELVSKNITQLEDIKKIKFDNFIFSKELSTEKELFFIGRK